MILTNFAKVVTIVRKLEDLKKNSSQASINTSKGTFYVMGSRFYKSN
jgi:hypothetical protein